MTCMVEMHQNCICQSTAHIWLATCEKKQSDICVNCRLRSACAVCAECMADIWFSFNSNVRAMCLLFLVVWCFNCISFISRRLVLLHSCVRLTHSHTMTPFGNKPFENTLGKGEIARNEQFLLLSVFSTGLNNFLLFSSNLKLSSAKSFNLKESEICHLVMG